MREGLFEIRENTPLTHKVSRMRLGGDASAIAGPGQFVSLRLPELFLRRPFSVCDAEEDGFTILYEAVGRGTEAMRALPVGARLEALTGLGTGYDLSLAGDAPLLIGGGTGASPLYFAAKRLLAAGKPVQVVLGFNTAADVLYEDEFLALGAAVSIRTVDGSYGRKGTVTEALPPHSHFFACGSEAMMRAVCAASPVSGQLCFDVRMGCGYGACMGCTRNTVKGPKRMCKEGPVLRKEEILWDD